MGNKETKKVPEQSASDKMFDMIWEFKNQAKVLKKEATKAEMAEKAFVLKVKDSIERNNPETAKIHAADAIRKRTEAKRYLTLSSKLDAVHARLQSAYQTQKVSYLFFVKIYYKNTFSISYEFF
jgi:charged multivesicular body protein 1